MIPFALKQISISLPTKIHAMPQWKQPLQKLMLPAMIFLLNTELRNLLNSYQRIALIQKKTRPMVVTGKNWNSGLIQVETFTPKFTFHDTAKNKFHLDRLLPVQAIFLIVDLLVIGNSMLN